MAAIRQDGRSARDASPPALLGETAALASTSAAGQLAGFAAPSGGNEQHTAGPRPAAAAAPRPPSIRTLPGATSSPPIERLWGVQPSLYLDLLTICIASVSQVVLVHRHWRMEAGSGLAVFLVPDVLWTSLVLATYLLDAGVIAAMPRLYWRHRRGAACRRAHNLAGAGRLRLPALGVPAPAR